MRPLTITPSTVSLYRQWNEHECSHINEIRWGWKWNRLDRHILEKFPFLVKLNCSQSITPTQYLISTLEPISTLVNLLELNCSQCNITSLEPIRELVHLQTLKCTNNNITSLEPIRELVNLQYIDCNVNWVTSLEPIRDLVNLQKLDCSSNNIGSVELLSTLVNLRTLICFRCDINSLEGVGSLVNLQTLICPYNNIESLEPLSTLVHLQTLNFLDNQITSLNPIIYLRSLIDIKCEGNPLEPPTIQITRFLDRLYQLNGRHIRGGPSRARNVYQDRQNVHDPHIQRTVCDSLQSLLADPAPDDFTLDTIVHSSLSDHTKELLIEYGQDSTPHSIHLITYQELLSYVWQRIVNSSDSNELFKILEDEIADAECKCFTGRFNRTLSVLSGFYDDIRINISDRSQIGAIISAAEHDVVPYHANDHRSLARQRLLELGYAKDEVEEWLEYIEE